jgi:hypothetical protein
MPGGHGRHFLAKGFIIPFLGFVIVYRAMCTQYLAGLPNADLVLFMYILDQFSFFSRP